MLRRWRQSLLATRALVAFAAPLLTLTAGCPGPTPPCFEQSSLIIDPRIIAIRTDPPEATVDLSGIDPITPSSVAALVVTAAYAGLYEYGRAVQADSFPTTISVCLPPNISEVDAQPGCPSGSLIVGQLPSVPTLTNPFTYKPSLQLLQAAVDQDPLHGLAGIQLRLQLSLATATAPIVSTKTLSYQLKGSLASVNHPLDLVGMEVSAGGVHTSAPAGGVIDIFVARFTGLRPLIGPGPGAASAVESYYAYDNQGSLIQLTEHVTYAFYAGNALFFGSPHNGEAAIYSGAAGDVADEPPVGAPDPPDGLATVEGVFTGNQAGSFWVIARDGRGAEAWMLVPYSAKDLRPCAAGAGEFGGGCPALFFGCN